MMNIDSSIYGLLCNETEITSKLALYDGCPAVFNQEAPADTSEKWNGEQFPRLIFAIDMQADRDRKSAGMLQISIHTTKIDSIYPEDIVPSIKKVFENVFISSGSLFSLAWNKTELFDIPDKVANVKQHINGADLIYDILEFPSQITCNPDPIQALNQFISIKYKDSIDITNHKTGVWHFKNDHAPVFYSRLINMSRGLETNTVVWMNAQISVHIFNPDSENRMKIITDLANTLAIDGEVQMLDYSPMQLKRIQVNYDSDFFTDGQIKLDVKFGILRYKPLKPKLKTIFTTKF